MTHKARSWLLASMVALAAGAGCNAITGADGLEAVGVPGGDEVAGPSTTGAGTVGSTGAGGTGTTAVTTGPVEPPPDPLVHADGVNVTDIDLYQALRRPIVANGQAASSDLPIVAGRDAFVRVFYTTDGAYNGQPVTAQLTINDGEPIEKLETLGGSSDHQALGSTINFDVPGAQLTPGSTFKVEFLQPSETVSGANGQAAYPNGGGTAPLDVQQGGTKLKIMLVPVDNYGSLPDTSAEQVQRYYDWFIEQYPIPEVEITVRSQPYVFNGNLSSFNGWSNLLDSVTNLRDADNAPNDVYYYGIHDASNSGLLGLGWVGGSSDVWSRTAIGVGWSGDTAPETAVHEVGHNHGRDHSPCGVSGDPNFPHSGASIGVWGYRPRTKKLLSPNKYVDFMSYCSPTWISDYNFKKIFTRLKSVSAQPKILIPKHLKNRSYDRIKILEGKASWKDSVKMSHPPVGESKQVEITTKRGGKKTVTGHYYAYNHIDGGLMYVMQPLLKGTPSVIQQASFKAEGQDFSLSR